MGDEDQSRTDMMPHYIQHTLKTVPSLSMFATHYYRGCTSHTIFIPITLAQPLFYVVLGIKTANWRTASEFLIPDVIMSVVMNHL
jgi:hypothetical protein